MPHALGAWEHCVAQLGTHVLGFSTALLAERQWQGRGQGAVSELFRLQEQSDSHCRPLQRLCSCRHFLCLRQAC